MLAAENDARMKTAEWRSIQTAYYARTRSTRLLRINDYEKTHPGVLTDQIATLREGTLDRLWFERIDQLWQKRDGLVKRAGRSRPGGCRRAGRDRPEVDDHPREAEPAAQELEGVTKELEGEMEYTGDAALVTSDESQLAELRRQRDPDLYARWKQAVITSVNRRGELPFLWEP